MRLSALALLLALAAPPADPRSLREADAALARSVANGDRKAFAALLDEDTFFSSGGTPLDGRTEVLESWDDLFAQGGPKLTWEPSSPSSPPRSTSATPPDTSASRPRTPPASPRPTRGATSPSGERSPMEPSGRSPIRP